MLLFSCDHFSEWVIQVLPFLDFLSFKSNLFNCWKDHVQYRSIKFMTVIFLANERIVFYLHAYDYQVFNYNVMTFMIYAIYKKLQILIFYSLCASLRLDFLHFGFATGQCSKLCSSYSALHPQLSTFFYFILSRHHILFWVVGIILSAFLYSLCRCRVLIYIIIINCLNSRNPCIGVQTHPRLGT